MTHNRLLSLAIIGLLGSASTLALAQTAPQTSAAPVKSAPATKPAANKGQEVEEIEVRGRFISRGAASATKLNISERDTPQSVTAYTNAFMKSIETREVADLYRYMTGIQRAGNTGYDIAIRGFKGASTDRNSIMVDGLPGLTVRFGSPPTAGTERIEVVKGPSSILYGQVQPGGFVNIISKKPMADAQTTLGISGSSGLSDIGNVKGYDVSVDSTGPVPGTSNLLYRLVAEEGHQDTFRRKAYEKPVYLVPSLTWLIDENTTATVQFEHRQTETGYDTYLVAPNNDVHLAPRIDTRYQNDGDRLRESGQTESVYLSHTFDNGLKWNFNFRNVYHRDTALGYDVVAVLANLNEVSIRARNQLNIRTYQFGDTNLTANLSTGFVSHQLIGGLSLGRETLDTNRRQFFNIPTSPTSGTAPVHTGALNIYKPIFNASILPLNGYAAVNPTTPANLNDRYTVSDAMGAYASDLMTLSEHWKAMVGVRYSKEKSTQSELRIANVTPTSSDNDDVLPTAGLIFQPTNEWSLYTSYSESFVPAPSTALDITGKNSFVPTTADSVEGGVKAELWDKRINATAAIFRINKQNVISTFSGGLCPTSVGTCSQQVGAERVTGGEFEVNASPIENMQLAMGYSHLLGKVVKSTIIQQNGALLTNVPKDNFHIWARYDLPSGPLAGLGAGLGFAYIGKRTGLLPTATVAATMNMPGYSVVDLGLYYTYKNYDLTFKVSNLFDKRYFESAGFSGQINLLAGAPRSATLSLRAHF
jgi:iron complex outermembrane receptor protein